MRLNSIELFSGAGGLAIGLQAAGMRHRYLIEKDFDSCENIRKNQEIGNGIVSEWNVIESDVRSIKYSGLSEKIDVVAGGPPCQPFSLGGKHRANNDTRDMFPEAVRAVRELEPRVFIFENVKGLVRKSFATYFNYILLQLSYPELAKRENEEWIQHLSRLEMNHTGRRFEGLKYNVIFRLLNAADFGVPQVRNRVIIVGFRNDCKVQWNFPEPTHSLDALLFSKWISGEYWEKHRISMKKREKAPARYRGRIDRLRTRELIRKLNHPWRTVRDAINDLPDPVIIGSSTKIPNHEFRPGARSYPGHTGSVLDEPSKTLKAGDHGVPGGENMIRLDDGEIRYFTVRESARIQTFPDEYLFFGSWTENMRQIGNAVPVTLAHAIGDSIVCRLKGST